MVEISVPGKLFVAGEYSVLSPGEPAVLVAVDRVLRVSAEPVPAFEPGIAGTVCSVLTGASPVALVREEKTGVQPLVRRYLEPLRHVCAAVGVVDRYLRESGRTPVPFAIVISSELDDSLDGVKLGLGSSGAVTVAVVRALVRLNRLAVDEIRLLKLALLAGVAVDPRGSGGDIAASLFGGWIAYRPPDRQWLARGLADRALSLESLLAQGWADLTAERLPPPRALRPVVGWTGTPALSSAYIDRISLGHRGYRRLVEGNSRCVTGLIAALRRGEDVEVQARLRQARRLLREFDAATGLGIETRRLATLCRIAAELGVAAKSSGAGGGDCGIALAGDEVDRELRARWRHAGLRPLPLAVYDHA